MVISQLTTLSQIQRKLVISSTSLYLRGKITHDVFSSVIKGTNNYFVHVCTLYNFAIANYTPIRTLVTKNRTFSRSFHLKLQDHAYLDSTHYLLSLTPSYSQEISLESGTTLNEQDLTVFFIRHSNNTDALDKDLSLSLICPSEVIFSS